MCLLEMIEAHFYPCLDVSNPSKIHVVWFKISQRYGYWSKPWHLVNPKIAGKWMFIPLELIIIGFDPPPYKHTLNSCWPKLSTRLSWLLVAESTMDRFFFRGAAVKSELLNGKQLLEAVEADGETWVTPNHPSQTISVVKPMALGCIRDEPL